MLVLASQSPRRRELLAQLGVPLVVAPSDYLEENDPHLTPAELVQTQSLGKAQAVAPHYPGALILGADTVVVCGGQLLGKPTDSQQAHEMLASLQGRWHEVHTGLSFVQDGAVQQHHEVTHVHLTALTDLEIRDYVATGEPLDKAGAYGIQGLGAAFVAEIQGSYTNVVGLPLTVVYQVLRARGWTLCLGQQSTKSRQIQ
ncbi:nucleoside triphosphate pyrophosphatase [Candidatus Cyanaurora vandensis]|uniref:Maf family protein n=1 Tax=Candidatus Cyanaurora vandensis TaxID=2714958 RepID=UPI00257DCBF2|nr:Maf family protein [Candidatus Cyanaurora vandensis]